MWENGARAIVASRAAWANYSSEREAGLILFIRRWGPALAIMAVIFYSSSIPQATMPGIGGYWTDYAAKKFAHLVVYGLLALAGLRGLAYGRGATLRDARWALALAVAYGASDELHQALVPGRGAGPLDVVFDALGAGLALWLWPRISARGRSVQRQKD